MKDEQSGVDLEKAKEEMQRHFYRSAIDYITDTVELSKLTKSINYALQGDGIYAIAKNRIGKFILRIVEREFPGLPKQFNGNKLILDVPKIPSSVYYQIKKFFTDISQSMGEAEAFCQVYYDLVEKRYIVHVPEQVVSKAAVNYDAINNLNNANPERYILVFEIHSHNTMGAFWSGTDDSDEKDTRFFGVLGELDKEVIGEKYRTMVLGTYVDISKDIIFDFSKDNQIDKAAIFNLLNNIQEDKVDAKSVMDIINLRPEPSYPTSWRTNIKQHSRAVTPEYQTTSTPWKANSLGMPAGRNWSGNSSEDWEWGNNPISTKKSYKSRWDEQDDYDNAWGTSVIRAQSNDPEHMAWAAIREGEIQAGFTLHDIEEEFVTAALNTVAATIDEDSVEDMLEFLDDYGHEEVMMQWFATYKKRKAKKAKA